MNKTALKITVISGLVIFISLLVFLTTTVLLQKKPQKDPLINEELSQSSEASLFVPEKYKVSPHPRKITNDYHNTEHIIAAKINLNAITLQKDNSGLYTGFLIEKANGSKQPLPPDNRTGLGVIFGRYNFYKATNEASELIKLGDDLEVYANKEIVPIIQNNLWNCKIMYWLWNDSYLPQVIKENAKTICDRGIYYVKEMEGNTGLLPDKPQVTVPAPNLNTVFTNKNINLPANEIRNENDKLIEYAGFSSDFVYKYLWHKNSIDLDTAKSLFNLALEKYSRIKSSDFVHGQCVLGTSSLDLYYATEESKYLDFAKRLYNSSKLSFCLSDVKCKDNLFDKTTCGFFTNELYNHSQSKEYLILKNDLVVNILNSHFDYFEYAGNIKNNGFFYQKFVYPDLKRDIIINIRDNGLTAGLLSLPAGKEQ